MKKILILIIGVLTVLIIGCNNNSSIELENQEKIDTLRSEVNQLKEEKNKLKQDIDNLEESNKKYESKLLQYKIAEENFPWISNLALDFVRGHTSGDKEKLRELIGPELKLKENNGKLYITYKVEDQEIEYMLYNKNTKYVFQDMVIQGYGYNSEKEIMMVHIREFYTNNKGEIVSPPTFLNLGFKKIDNEWKITLIEFDV